MSEKGKQKSQLYFDEAKEQLELVEQTLLLLEQSDEVDLSLVNEIFRGVHTIKGGADFLGLDQIKQLSHAAEDVLDLVRQQKLNLSADGISTLLVVIDCLKEMLTDPDNSQSIDISSLLEDIKELSAEVADDVAEEINVMQDDTGVVALGTPSAPKLFIIPSEECNDYWKNDFNLFILDLSNSDSAEPGEERNKLFGHLNGIGYVLDSKSVLVSSETGQQSFFVLFRTVLSGKMILKYLEPEKLHSLQNQLKPAQSEDAVANKEIKKIHNRVRESRTPAKSPQVNADFDDGLIQEGSSFSGARGKAASFLDSSDHGFQDRRSKGGNSIRVNIEILDDLMSYVGELVLTRNQLNQNVAVSDEVAIALAAQRLDVVTSELQASIMSTRMQPLGIVLTRFHRIIRDMSKQLGKSVNLVLEGEGVELDKTIIENIGDPLTHLVRNAIDHGFETPDVRRNAHKNEVGTLSIKARHEAGHVVIEIADDGKGIDPEQIRQKALQDGVIDKARAEEITEKELLKLVFSPGFSTADVVSDISGRGVGLDVVYTNISRLGGSVDIYSNVGVGTTFRVSLPLTLAIVPSLLVSSNNDTFVIPQLNLVELVRIPPDKKKSRIEHLGDTVVVRLRDKLLPLVWLDKVLGLREKSDDKDESTNIAVVKAGDFYYGIVVDNFTDSQEIVVKPLGSHLRHCLSYAGATVLGDGSAAMILDVGGIAQFVNMAHQDAEIENQEILEKAQANVGKEQQLLIVENGENEYFGIELAYVNRIERIHESSIQSMANKDVVKYRGGTLRVFKLEDAIDSKQQSREANVYLVVFHMMGREIAVMVSNIIDIVDTRADVDKRTFVQPGVVGSAIIMERITLLLDLFELVKVIDPAMHHESSDMVSAPVASGSSSQHTALVVEDSMFFQDKLRIVLEEMGINVLLAEDGKIGWEMLNSHPEQIDLVLTDIEMPNMSGLELTRKIRSKSTFQNLPIVMLTSLAKETDIEEGMKAGANEYLVKMDQELVKKIIRQYLDEKESSASVNALTKNDNAEGGQHAQR